MPSEDSADATRQRGGGDVDHCPKCGEKVPPEATSFTNDLVLNRYRTEFQCPGCGYHGEVFRHG